MTNYAISNPYPSFNSVTGLPLTGAHVYVGIANMDPEANPQAVYWDAAGAIPASQPLSTIGGYIIRSGTPAQAFTAGSYSIRVYNSQGALVFYQAVVANPLTDFIATLAASGGAANIGFIDDATGSIATTVQTRLRQLNVTLEQFGGVGDGTTDNKAAFDLFRAYVAAVQGSDSTAWVTLELQHGKVYASRDNGWLLGLTQVIVEGNGATFKNICTVGNSAYDFDHFPIVLGAPGYVDVVTTMMAGKSFSVNYANNYLINTVARGSATVTTTTAGDAGNFTAGDWVLICSDIAYVGGSPPSMHFFEYAKVLTAVAGTGVITLANQTTRNAYSSARSNSILSGQFGSKARIFKLDQKWNCRQIIRNLNVAASANFSTLGGYAFGRTIDLQYVTSPGITASQCDNFSSIGGTYEGGAIFEPVDKLVASAIFDHDTFRQSIQGDGSGGQALFRGANFRGDVRALRNAAYEGCGFGKDLQLNKCSTIRLVNNNAAGSVTYENTVDLTVDGTTITFASNVITVPLASIVSGNEVAQFVADLTVGCKIDEVSGAGTGSYYNGKYCIVTAMTDDGTNMAIGVSYTGGAAIANGTVFRSPHIRQYQATGNLGAGYPAGTAGTSATGIVNGDLNAAKGNFRKLLISPISGDTVDVGTNMTRGRAKKITVNVIRPYTGTTHTALYLEFYEYAPTFAGWTRDIDLRIPQCRELTKFTATSTLDCTITIASPGVVTWANHGLVTDQRVTFSTTGALPTGLVAGTAYYAIPVAANTFQVSATAGGAAINTSGTQSGVHTMGQDTWSRAPTTFVGRLAYLISATKGGAAAALAEATDKLPIVEITFEFEDDSHDVPVAY